MGAIARLTSHALVSASEVETVKQLAAFCETSRVVSRLLAANDVDFSASAV